MPENDPQIKEAQEDERARKNRAILEKLKVLQQGYAEQVPGKIRQIETDWPKLLEHWDRKILTDLERFVHSLTGSGKTFGFPEISTTARELETRLRNFLQVPTEPSVEQKQQTQLSVSALLEALNDAHGTVCR